MGSSFIDLQDYGFWARDGLVEAMQLCIINEIELQKLDLLDWMNEFKNELALQALPLIYGGMSMALEEFLTSDLRKNQLLQLIDAIIEKIDATDTYITGENLHKMRKRAMTILSETGKMEFDNQTAFEAVVNESRWKESNRIWEVKDNYKHAFELLKQLINGEMKSTASSPEYYWDI